MNQKTISPATRILTRSGLLLLGVLLAAILLNLAVGLLPESLASPDLTGKDTFHISGTTLDLLENQTADVTLYLLCEGGRSRADGDLYAFLSRYAEASPHITLRVIDPARDTDFIAAHGGSLPSDMSVVVESDLRYKIIDNTDLYYYLYSGGTLSPLEYAALQEIYAAYEDSAYYLAQLAASVTAYFNGESRLTNAIRFVSMEKTAKAYFVTENVSMLIPSELESTLNQGSYDLCELATLRSIPDDCDLLILNAPTSDLTPQAASSLTAYLNGGGKLFLTTEIGSDAENFPRLAELLATYGMHFAEAENDYLVCENAARYQLDSSAATPYLFYSHISPDHAATSPDFDGQFAMLYAHAITLTETEGVTLTPWLYTSESGYLMDTAGQEFGERDTYNCGTIAKKGDSEILWISSSYALSSSANSYSGGGNFALTVSAMNYLTGVSSPPLSLSARPVSTNSLLVSSSSVIVWAVILVLILPSALIFTGYMIRYIRKQR